MSLTQEQIQEYEAKHTRIAHLRGGDGAWEIVLRKPTRAEYKHFRSMSHGASAADAQEFLVRKCCVYPADGGIDALLEEWPGIPEASGKAIMSIAGMAASDDVK